MTGVPIAPRRVFGVAFSASGRPGEATWVCRAHPGEAGLRIESVDPLAELPGGGVELDEACRAIVTKVLEAPRSAWGLHFAFGLPRREGADRPGLAPGLEQWKTMLETVAASSDPDSLEHPGGRRRTDRDRDLPGPLDAERRRETFHGISGILGRLHGREGVAILPIDPLPLLPQGTPPAMRARAPSTYLLESDPAAVLRALPAAAGGPIDAPPPEPAGREEAIRALVGASWLRPVPRTIRQRAASVEAGLGAVLVAVGAWRGYRTGDHGRLCRDPAYGTEGHVYC